MAKKDNYAIADGSNIRKSCEQQLGRQWNISAMCEKIRAQGPVPDPIEVIIDVTSLPREEIENLQVNDCLMIHAPAYENGNGELKSIGDCMILGRINTYLNHTRGNLGRLLLLSGDKDLIEGVHAWHRRGGEVYVLGIPGSVSQLLIKAADKFIPLMETQSNLSGDETADENYTHQKANSLLCGRIISYSKIKGFGFIESPNRPSEKFFFHINGIADDVVKNQLLAITENKGNGGFLNGLSIGVAFEDAGITRQGEKYHQAVNVKQLPELEKQDIGKMGIYKETASSEGSKTTLV
ncbi:TPA: NYN domain-containing protein [Candidatus Poribacteria bacterium]|nr:NYN domain-containing protein [Candidatus Poribacteria bacterium]